MGRSAHLEFVRSLVAVCAHPDDEAFGLGAVLDNLEQRGIHNSLLCFTHGEASTLGTHDGLAERRADELQQAAASLGLRSVTLRHHPDGDLSSTPLDDLADDVAHTIADAAADCVLVFDLGGITGHPDHERATAAALAAAERLDLPVLAWTLTDAVASTLRTEFGMPFAGRTDDELDIEMKVERTRQWTAIRCHASQSTDNPVLLRRLALQGDTEVLRWLRRPHEEADR